MSKRKILTVFLFLVLTVTLTALTTGCNQAEKEFIQLHEEISKLNTLESSGQYLLSVNAPALPPTATDSEVRFFNLLQKGIKLKYTSKADIEKELIESSIFYVDEQTGTEQEILKMLCKDDTFYFKIDGLIKFAQKMGSPETSVKLKEVFADTEYIRLTKAEYLQLCAGNKEQDPITANMLQNNKLLDNKFNRMMQKFFYGLPSAFENYQSDLVVKNENGYTLEITGMKASEKITPFLTYSINNIEKLETYFISFLDNLTNEETVLLGMNSQQKDGYKMLCKMFTEAISQNKAEYLQKAAALQAELQKDQDKAKEILDNMSLKYSIEKKGPDSYANYCTLQFLFKEKNEQVDFHVEVQNDIKPLTSLTVNVPTSKVMNYSELEQRITQTMEVEVDKKTYHFKNRKGTKQEELNVLIIDNHTYLPLRKIAETFEENVGWDSAQGKAYILRNTNKIDMIGTIINGRTYIKIRDFEKLGYKVDWDNATRKVKITVKTL